MYKKSIICRIWPFVGHWQNNVALACPPFELSIADMLYTLSRSDLQVVKQNLSYVVNPDTNSTHNEYAAAVVSSTFFASQVSGLLEGARGQGMRHPGLVPAASLRCTDPDVTVHRRGARAAERWRHGARRERSRWISQRSRFSVHEGGCRRNYLWSEF